ncbi:MAG: hypothetical protein JSR87_10100 [Proteobacteria bacterium]|nr:hypothetical protein [Pseudomonadota bacterium]MBS0574243.1 hypothetical protein [Pseudomonadota bacterium]
MQLRLPHRALCEVLLSAFQPCPEFGSCAQARWIPERGHVPRGFLGATGELRDVKVVMIFAEPGHPYEGDDYSGCASPQEMLRRTIAETYRIFRNGTDLFHRNARWFLDQVWPGLDFDQQLQHVWLTEGRLCSIESEAGGFKDRLCAPRYLKRQLDLLPHAVAIPFGGKARDRIDALRASFLPGVFSLAPPGANQKGARPSWEHAIDAVRACL